MRLNKLQRRLKSKLHVRDACPHGFYSWPMHCMNRTVEISISTGAIVECKECKRKLQTAASIYRYLAFS